MPGDQVMAERRIEPEPLVAHGCRLRHEVLPMNGLVPDVPGNPRAGVRHGDPNHPPESDRHVFRDLLSVPPRSVEHGIQPPAQKLLGSPHRLPRLLRKFPRDLKKNTDRREIPGALVLALPRRRSGSGRGQSQSLDPETIRVGPIRASGGRSSRPDAPQSISSRCACRSGRSSPARSAPTRETGSSRSPRFRRKRSGSRSR